MTNEIAEQKPWTGIQKFFLYFICIYFILYSFPFPFDFLASILQQIFTWIYDLTGWHFLKTINGAIDAFFGYWLDFLHWLIPGFAKNILHLKNQITVFSNGSGDTTYDYVVAFFYFILSLIGAGIWYFLAHKKTNHAKLYSYLLTGLRYSAGIILLNYGFAKIVQTQFPSPYLARYVQPYGESSPMGLAWTFMGQSTAYNFFTGFCEALGGFLLLFRRTQTFGSLFSMTVVTVIFMMNMCFDVPVKLFSLHLLLFTILIALNDRKRLVNFFFLHKPTEKGTTKPFYAGFKKTKMLIVLKWIIIFYSLYYDLETNIDGYKNYGMGKLKPPLYGIYNAEYKIVNNDTIPLLYKDTLNWKHIIVSWDGYARMYLLNDSTRSYNFKVDTMKKTVEFYPTIDTTVKNNFSYTVDGDLLALRGRMKGDSVQMFFSRYDENKFLLKNRGFHWINEYPFNR
jgi:hypothetical protein